MIRSVYLVVEPVEIIASDLAMNVQEYDPSAQVLLAFSPEAAFDMLEEHAAVRLAFVHADPSDFALTSLAQALDSRGAQVVYTGDAAERKNHGTLVLQRPFSAQMTAALLRRTETSQVDDRQSGRPNFVG